MNCHLAKEFEIKGSEKLRCFLGIEVALYDKGIFISQRKHVLDLLEETVRWNVSQQIPLMRLITDLGVVRKRN